MVTRRRFLLAWAAIVTPLAARAQPPDRTRRIGILSGGRSTPDSLGVIDALQRELHKRGWVEGRTVAYELLWADGDHARYAEMALELLRRKVDVIVAPSADAALAAQRATTTVPIVMIWPVEPIRLGLIKSYARPGGNLTGLTTEAGSTIVVKYFDLLAQALPGLSRVAVLWNATSHVQRGVLEDMQQPARAHGVQIVPIAVRTPEELAPAFERMSGERAGALIILADPLFFPHRDQLAALALAHRLPAMSSVVGFVESGGLMRYIVAHDDLWRRAAPYVDRLLNGADPATLPVEQPNKFELVVNLRTARALGVDLPRSILVRADKVIE